MKIAPGIYPKIDTAEVKRNDPNRTPEMDVYEALARDLGASFYIFYNCNWQDPDPRRMLNRDGEADFIVAHPEVGYICLEVKGGDVVRDEKTRSWWRRIGTRRKSIKDPVEQSRRSKHVVFDLMREKWENCPVLRIKHGVILPNSGRPKGTERLGGDMPLDIFAFFEDMHALGGRVLEILMKEPGAAPPYGRLDDRGIQIIYDLFQRGLEFPISLQSELDHYDRRIESLTDEQKAFLEFTAAQRRLVVVGGAGSGKTFLALKKAEQLAAEKSEVLFLVFNTALARHLRRSMHDVANLKIYSFHEFCGWFCTQAGLETAAHSKQENFYSVVLPELLLEAMDKRDDIRFDALIVDEAQDLRPEWWETIFLSLRSFEGATICIFQDDNQNIYGGGNPVRDLLGVAPFQLTKNVRNTQSIFRATLPLYEGCTKRSAAPDGPSVRFLAKKAGQQAEAVRDEVLRLLNVEGVKPSQIAVLSLSALERSAAHTLNLGGVRCVLADDKDAADHLIHDSVWRFKGLERRIVILTDIEKFMDSRELMYVAFSRARTLLILVADQLAVSKLQSFVAAKT